MEDKYLIKISEIGLVTEMNEYQKAAVDGIEIWKSIKTKQSDLEISNLGNVRGIKYGGHPIDIKLVKGRKYLSTAPRSSIHRLVWKLFGGTLPKGYVIHHINKIKSDDRISNLIILSNALHTSLHHKNKQISEETREKLSKAHKGKLHLEKTREKSSKVHKNRMPWNKGNKKPPKPLKILSTEEILLFTKQEKRANKGTHWFNNGEYSVMSYDCPAGFVRGRLKKNL
jgi:hypothetical protein